MQTDNADIYENYIKDYKTKILEMQELKNILIKQFNSIVLWGAGMKGKAFLEIFDYEKQWIDFVVDIDDKKQGQLLPTGHEIKNAESITENMVVIITNERLYPSICTTLVMKDYHMSKLRLLCVESYFDKRVSLDDLRSGRAWERKKYYD